MTKLQDRSDHSVETPDELLLFLLAKQLECPQTAQWLAENSARLEQAISLASDARTGEARLSEAQRVAADYCLWAAGGAVPELEPLFARSPDGALLYKDVCEHQFNEVGRREMITDGPVDRALQQARRNNGAQ